MTNIQPNIQALLEATEHVEFEDDTYQTATIILVRTGVVNSNGDSEDTRYVFTVSMAGDEPVYKNSGDGWCVEPNVPKHVQTLYEDQLYL